MLALRLPKDIEDRLDALAKRTGRTKSYYARKAIVEMMEDLEDIALAREVLAEGGEPIPLEKLLEEFADEWKR
jgi:RHH-type rel operon transcriptional repressor/antitoxin RelB